MRSSVDLGWLWRRWRRRWRLFNHERQHCRDDERYHLRHYERHYKRTVSWYQRPLNYVRHRAELEGDPEASDFTVAFGMSVMPFFSVPNVLAGLAQRLRLRLGLRLDAKHWEPSLRRLEVGSTMYVR